MTQQELFERHKTMCEDCNKINCNGIHISARNTTICECGEMKEPLLQEINRKTIINDFSKEN